MDHGCPQIQLDNRNQQDRRRLIWLWVLFIVLVVSISGIIYLLIPTIERPSQPAHTPPETVSDHWGDRYSYAGLPKITSSYPVIVLTNTGYLVGYSESRKDPLWVCYRLFRPDSFQAPPRPQGFTTDYRTAARADSHDFTGSGYDRGHMAPNYAIAVCYGPKAQLETFLMSNIIPQRPALNRQIWERLEQTEIKEYAPRFRQIWVIDGPIFHNRTRLKGGEDVPDACFKIIVREDDGRPIVLAFIMPQTVKGTESAQQYLTSIDEIEKETGLDFFSMMPVELQQRFEADAARAMW
jgi:endonuclease G